MKYKEWLYEWLENYVHPTAKDKTYRRYSEVAEKHLMPVLGDRELTEITLQEVQWFVTSELQSGNQKTGGGMSPSSVNLTISVIQNSMRTANTLGLVPTYELHKIKRPKVKEKKVECFTKAEQKQIEAAVLADSRPKMIGVLLCLYTGLRLGEVMALEWSDIDFQKGELSVTKACHDATKPGGGFERITGTPKTDSSVRTIPIPRQILPYLREAKKQNGSKFVVGDGDKVLSLRSYQLSFEGLLKRLKIPHRGFHSLRHTFATRALECGMDVRTLADILGHDNPMITLKRYAHSMEEHKKEMMNRVGKLL